MPADQMLSTLATAVAGAALALIVQEVDRRRNTRARRAGRLSEALEDALAVANDSWYAALERANSPQGWTAAQIAQSRAVAHLRHRGSEGQLQAFTALLDVNRELSELVCSAPPLSRTDAELIQLTNRWRDRRNRLLAA
ncbi:MAG TPA: hypothetical protein VEW93_08235 [Acidimicrobiales bacterium]|nr:hypothetical protein [Acidimicrobiales bacterium]